MSDHIQELIEGLKKPEAYSHEVVGEVQVIQTHISVIFLVGKFAYKICKPVNLGFLDFSSLEKRKISADKEVEFNSLISPNLYLGVVPISICENEDIKVDYSSGEIIEYAIKMKRCDQKNMMSELLKEGKAHTEDIIKLAKTIATFHKMAPMSEEISTYGKMETVKGNWNENFEQTIAAKDIFLSSRDYDFIKNKVETFLIDNSDLITKRVEDGHIKHCHGDLHSGNIFVENGQTIIFDGIIFNKRFPNSDTISDLATMLVDLEILDKKEFADLLLKTYQEDIQDPNLDKLLPFYKCYKAYVRAKVQFFIYSDPNVPEEVKEKILLEGKKYFCFAKIYAEKF